MPFSLIYTIALPTELFAREEGEVRIELTTIVLLSAPGRPENQHNAEAMDNNLNAYPNRILVTKRLMMNLSLLHYPIKDRGSSRDPTATHR